jgi:hypothetical protein
MEILLDDLEHYVRTFYSFLITAGADSDKRRGSTDKRTYLHNRSGPIQSRQRLLDPPDGPQRTPIRHITYRVHSGNGGGH